MKERRVHERLRVFLPTLVKTEGDTVMAMTENISEGGVRITIDVPLLESGHVNVSIRKNAEDLEEINTEILNAAGQVVWCIEDEEAGFIAGIRFIGLKGEKKRRFESFLTGLASR